MSKIETDQAQVASAITKIKTSFTNMYKYLASDTTEIKTFFTDMHKSLARTTSKRIIKIKSDQAQLTSDITEIKTSVTDILHLLQDAF